MPYIVLDHEQARVIRESAGPVEVRDPSGQCLGHVTFKASPRADVTGESPTEAAPTGEETTVVREQATLAGAWTGRDPSAVTRSVTDPSWQQSWWGRRLFRYVTSATLAGGLAAGLFAGQRAASLFQNGTAYRIAPRVTPLWLVLLNLPTALAAFALWKAPADLHVNGLRRTLCAVLLAVVWVASFVSGVFLGY